MSDLTVFRDHCRRMSEADHSTACDQARQRRADEDVFWRIFLRHEGTPRPDPYVCDGDCLSDTDRALFAQLAGEVDDYLAPQPDLFGDLILEPDLEEKTP